MIKVAILGLGGRGGISYASYQKYNPQLMKIVAIADICDEVLEKYKNMYSIPEENCFHSAEELLSKEKLADVAIIATMDRDHYKHCCMAIDKGYDILLEKPISPNEKECLDLNKRAKQKGVFLRICHVLRYTKYYNKLKELIASGVIGDVRGVNHTENIAYWHYAHSFIRGNWKNSIETSPIILQKCCHDTDILTYILGKKPTKVISLGKLDYFTRKNAPQGSPERCDISCPKYDTCPYNAVKFYIDGYEKGTEKERQSNWMLSALCHGNISLENLQHALKTTDYGKCVFKCNNDVCDHQTVMIEYETGTIATLTLSAFTQSCYRTTKIFGTLGEIDADDGENVIRLRLFNTKEQEIIDLNNDTDDVYSHNGGDKGLIEDFLNKINNIRKLNIEEPECLDDNIVLSHELCFASEKSRKKGGKGIKINGR